MAKLPPDGTSTVVSARRTDKAGMVMLGTLVAEPVLVVEVPSGGSFAIAGLLQHTTKQTVDQFPGLGEMPVLGALFRSRDFQNDETELAVVATAYLVKPGKERDFASPSDGFVPAADAETILLGRLNATYKNDPQGLKSAGAAKTGFIVE